jgi:twitching motility protein PilT
MTIFELLQLVIDKDASDLHLLVGSPAYLRVQGKLEAVPDTVILGPQDTRALLEPLLSPEQLQLFQINKELDFSYQHLDQGRFRVNIYTQKGSVAAAFRLIPKKIRTIDELLLPPIFHEVSRLKQGLVLITGPTGEGKSTSLAAVIEEINHSRSEHIITIEDPIEFAYEPLKSIISQREIHHDTHSWEVALKSVLREDPDVVLIGEMRDFETIAAALTIAETGHLVFATLHTNSAAQTVDRIIDVFPQHQQEQVRQQLSSCLEVVFSQRLVPAKNGSRVCAVEVMIATPAVRNLIREKKTYQIDSVLQTSSELGMMTMEANLVQWVRAGTVSESVGRIYATRPAEYDRLLR